MTKDLKIGDKVTWYDYVYGIRRSGIVQEISADKKRIRVSVAGKHSKPWLNVDCID